MVFYYNTLGEVVPFQIWLDNRTATCALSRSRVAKKSLYHVRYLYVVSMHSARQGRLQTEDFMREPRNDLLAEIQPPALRNSIPQPPLTIMTDKSVGVYTIKVNGLDPYETINL